MVAGVEEPGDTQASVELSIGAEGSVFGKATLSAEAVVYNDRQARGKGFRKLTWVNDLVAGGFFGTRGYLTNLREQTKARGPRQPCRVVVLARGVPIE